MIDLADQRYVAEEEPRAHQMQRLPGLAVLPVHLTQVPAPAMRSQHQQQAHRNLDPARNLLPVGRDEQDNAAGDEDRSHEGDDRQKPAPLFFQFEVLNNLPLLLRRDQPRFLDLLNVRVFHNVALLLSRDNSLQPSSRAEART